MKAILAISLLLFTAFSRAQSSGTANLAAEEQKLERLFNQLYSDTIGDPEPILQEIREIMPRALEMEGAFSYPWKRLNRIGIVSSDDGVIRLFTWHVMDDPDHYRYFGYIQLEQKRQKVKVLELTDNGVAQRDLVRLDQTAANWCGKLYYGIVTSTHRRKSFYTLLGMDFNNSRSNIKTVEAMAVHKQQPEFLHEMFFNGKDKVDRMVFEYSEQVSISVRFDPELRMITADHLIPFHPIYRGNYEFYGPDGSYDGLEFASGVWVYREDIDARNTD